MRSLPWYFSTLGIKLKSMNGIKLVTFSTKLIALFLEITEQEVVKYMQDNFDPEIEAGKVELNIELM